jgi:uncharacterized protein (UPF0332 family)
MNNPEFEKCLERGRIRKFPKAKTLVSSEIKLAGEDLQTAKGSLAEKNFKWATIQAYYSMFHTARSLLYAKGYREKSHFCLIESIRALYVSKSLLNFKFVETLKLGKSLRENADYYGDFSREGAEEMIESADEFLKEAKKILRKK